MQRHATIVTPGYHAQLVQMSSLTPMQIDGVDYFTATDIQREVGVVRQTIWRWRRAHKIPQGHLYRGRLVVFTREELEEIREFSNRIEPADPAPKQSRRKRVRAASPKRSA